MDRSATFTSNKNDTVRGVISDDNGTLQFTDNYGKVVALETLRTGSVIGAGRSP